MRALFRALGGLGLLLCMATVALSQSNEGYSSDNTYGGNRDESAWLTDEAAIRIAGQLKNAAKYCEWAPDDYVVDCLADQYTKIERSLPKTAAYKEVRRILGGTGKALQGVASKYSYGAKPVTIKRPPSGKFPTSATRALIPVPQAAQRRAVQAASRVVAEASTLLLRSAEQSAARRAPFEKVSAALGDSTKVLLRSA